MGAVDESLYIVLKENDRLVATMPLYLKTITTVNTSTTGDGQRLLESRYLLSKLVSAIPFTQQGERLLVHPDRERTDQNQS